MAGADVEADAEAVAPRLGAPAFDSDFDRVGHFSPPTLKGIGVLAICGIGTRSGVVLALLDVEGVALRCEVVAPNLGFSSLEGPSPLPSAEGIGVISTCGRKAPVSMVTGLGGTGVDARSGGAVPQSSFKSLPFTMVAGLTSGASASNELSIDAFDWLPFSPKCISSESVSNTESAG